MLVQNGSALLSSWFIRQYYVKSETGYLNRTFVFILCNFITCKRDGYFRATKTAAKLTRMEISPCENKF